MASRFTLHCPTFHAHLERKRTWGLKVEAVNVDCGANRHNLTTEHCPVLEYLQIDLCCIIHVSLPSFFYPPTIIHHAGQIDVRTKD